MRNGRREEKRGHGELRAVVVDPKMRQLYQQVDRIARSSATVLILGETGVGKDVLASLIHDRSGRPGPFVRLNCACLAPSLADSELFGHSRGAFTGAVSAKVGLIESANGGTLFLDEIGELPDSIQAKLLRVLESRELTPVGAVRPRTVDVRFIAATNQALETQVLQGRFRRDLFHRLNMVVLRVPPLRERPEDILPLAEHFLGTERNSECHGTLSLGSCARVALVAYPWPGNVRELRNVLARAALLASTPVLAARDLDLPDAITSPSTGDADRHPPPDTSGVQEERDRIRKALLDCAGNQTRAAELLGIPRRTLLRRLSRYGLSRPRDGRPAGNAAIMSAGHAPEQGVTLAREEDGGPVGSPGGVEVVEDLVVEGLGLSHHLGQS